MTVQSLNNSTDAIADGVQTVFPYDYILLNADHMTVLFDGVDQPLGWSVDGVGNPTGGNVTFSVAPLNLVQVTLLRDVPLTQEIDYTEYDPGECGGDWVRPVRNERPAGRRGTE